MAEIINAKISVLQKGYHRMTLPFGNQTLNNRPYKHKGVDLTGNPNINGGYDYILAFADGIVKSAGYLNDCGYWVKIDHGSGIVTRYMHMKKGTLRVKTGDKVRAGAVIGYMGESGNVTGRHLHFDISYSGNVVSKYGGFYVSEQDRTYVNPIPYLIGTKTLYISNTSGKPSLGTYTVKESVNVRKGAGVNYDRIYYSQFTFNAKMQVRKIDRSCPDCFPAGIKVTIKEVKQAANGTWWGKCPTGWVCMKYLTK